MDRIIYTETDGQVVVLIPSPTCLQTHTIQEIAEKDVPSGRPYKIVSIDDIPSDRTFRDAWEVDEATLTDGTGGENNLFITDPQHPDYVEPSND